MDIIVNFKDEKHHKYDVVKKFESIREFFEYIIPYNITSFYEGFDKIICVHKSVETYNKILIFYIKTNLPVGKTRIRKYLYNNGKLVEDYNHMFRKIFMLEFTFMFDHGLIVFLDIEYNNIKCQIENSSYMEKMIIEIIKSEYLSIPEYVWCHRFYFA